AKHKYHHLPVVDGEQLIGIISTTDLMNLNIPDYGHDLIDKVIDRKFKLVEFIKTDLATIDAETTIKDALLILLSSDFHSLPVTDTSNRLLGMLTTKDMLKLLISNET
ncbi:MAG: CBS domain-containing protein, partial [Calditrichaeota bacterium]|nr:CBS domain-containing protein [Calditrichota bacterium]